MSAFIWSFGSAKAFRALTSPTTFLADSWSFQKPSSPIFSSSCLRLSCFPGTSKRVPDGNHPGAKVFDGLREVLVDHEISLAEAARRRHSQPERIVRGRRLPTGLR